MSEEETFIYSPFSRHTVWDQNCQSMLLQFILTELFLGLKEDTLYMPSATFFPFDWSRETGRLNKIEEHLQLLLLAFPKMNQEHDHLKEGLKTQNLPHLFAHLKPFLLACRDTKGLLPFLQKHTVSINEFCSCKELLKELDSEPSAS